ncbi:MAG: hypothetical protein J6J31_05920 [Thermoguttaceae bacterium]|nr:hypothetical protein [Thermoguttaceae bacterium]
MSPKETQFPFAPIEEYMMRDDTTSHPMDSIRLLHFSGQLCRKTIQSAVEAVCTRHPLLNSVAEKRGNRHWWVETDQKPEIAFLDADATPEVLNASGFPIMRPLELLQEPGFRLYAVFSQKENWTKLLFQFHHSVSDGLGEMQILGEFVTHCALYSGLIPQDTQFPACDISKLPLRMKVGWTLAGYLRHYFHTAFTTMRLAFGSPNPLFPHQPVSKDAPPSTVYPFLQSLTLTQDETRTYVQKAKRLGVTVNDLLLRDFYLTIDAWRVKNCRDFSNGKTRIMVPMTLRQPWHEGIPAANVVSAIFLDRSKHQISGDPQKLLDSIHREMVWAKTHDQKFVFMLIMYLLQKIPGVLPFFLRSSKCRATGVLSNLGRVMELAPVPRDPDGRIRLGECVLESIDAAPPIRFKTLISFSALTYAGTLRLCLRYDDRFMKPKDADDFLRIFHEKLMG